jgi:serine/threonine protein kinase
MSGYEANPDLPIGTLIRGTYTVEKRLGEGAFGVVYRVRHRFLGSQAMKVLATKSNDAGATSGEIIEEARVLATLVDPHVIRLFEANTLDPDLGGYPFITMEYVHGGTLESFLDAWVRLHPLSALKVARQICTGLGIAHRHDPPIVHRDITGCNVLVSSVSPHGTPQIKVGDFGLACYIDLDSRMVRPAGTLVYLAPEAIWGYHTPTSDVYSIGVLLYRLLTGVYPFPLPSSSDRATAATLREAILRSHRTVPLPPSAFRPELSRDVDVLLRRVLAPDAHSRPQDAVAFGSELDDILRHLQP